jgi:hypothetical protein
MDIKAALLAEHSKTQMAIVAAYIGDDERQFRMLMELFLGDSYRVTQRAAWAVSHCADKYPYLIAPYIEIMIKNLYRDVPDAVKRNTLRLLQDREIPDTVLEEAADIGFKIMERKGEPIAVKVFAMTMLANICKKVPELKNELKMIIEDQMPYGSAGFRSRGGKILRQLAKHN